MQSMAGETMRRRGEGMVAQLADAVFQDFTPGLYLIAAVTALLEPEHGALARALSIHPRSDAWLGAPIVDAL